MSTKNTSLNPNNISNMTKHVVFRPVEQDKVMVDYSLRSAGNSNMRYLAGILQPAVTSGSLGEVDLETNDFRFVPVSGKLFSDIND